MTTCSICEIELEPDDNGLDTPDGLLCAACFGEHWCTCEDCGEVIRKEDAQEVNSATMCESCADEYYTCEDCGRSFREHDGEWIARYDIFVCDACIRRGFTRCDDCGAVTRDNEIIHTYSGGDICPDCCEGDYYICDDCGGAVHTNDTTHTASYVYCPDCTPEDEDNEEVNSYGYKPEPICRKCKPEQARDLCYLGVELEMECTNGVGRVIDALAPYRKDGNGEVWYYKSDGSLSDNGVELVTHPVTLAYHTLEVDWKGALEAAAKVGARSHDTDTCGLHVHVSRAPFPQAALIKLAAFVHAHPQELGKLARRRSSKWASYDGSPRGAKSKVTCPSDRYVAVNFCNRDTVELRIFKGTLKPATFKATIELAHAIPHFCSVVDIATVLQYRNGASPWQAFCQYVERNCKSYPTLPLYMEHHNVFTV